MIWTSETENVDIETGEVIDKYRIRKKYTIIKINKKITYNDNHTRGYIKYTNECRKKPEQGELFK